MASTAQERVFVARLLRLLSEDDKLANPESTDCDGFTFTLTIRALREDNSIAATSDAFGDMLAGVGRTYKQATEDLLSAVEVVVDHHIDRGTLDAFMGERFTTELEVTWRGHPQDVAPSWLKDVRETAEPEPHHALAAIA